MTDSSFHEVLFPEDVSYGSSGGPGFSTTVVSLTSGYEQRNVNWQDAKATYEATHGVKTREQMEALLEFFYARMGKAYGFRYKDWADFTIEDGVVAQFDGTTQTVQLYKRYEPETSFFYDRTIKKFVPSSLDGTFYSIDANGTRTNVAPNQYSLDYNTGLFTMGFKPPAGTSLFVEYIEYHVPVRFDTDEMKVTQDAWESMSWPSIELVELKLRS